MSDVGGPFEDKEFDEFWLSGLFPDPNELFSVHQQPVSAIKKDCIVALDANVLLLPYELGSSSFTKVAELYKRLADEGRLLIPAQAAREFVKNRAMKLRDLVKYMNDQASALSFSLHEQISFLGDENAFKKIKEQSQEIEKSRKVILKQVNSIRETLISNVGCDPVSTAYRDVFNGTVYELKCDGEESEKLRTEAVWRYRHKIPPGYKDRNKDDGGLGDFIIWKTLLDAGESRGKDIIFVTKDIKGDWWVQSQGAFQPRIELIEEYYRATKGRTIHLMSLSQLLETFEAAKEAVSDVRRAEDVVLRKTMQRNYLGKLKGQLLGRADNSASFDGYSLAHLFAEKHELERRVIANQQASRPIREQLSVGESLSEDELTHLVAREREFRSERSALRQRIFTIEAEISRRASGASDSGE